MSAETASSSAGAYRINNLEATAERKITVDPEERRRESAPRGTHPTDRKSLAEWGAYLLRKVCRFGYRPKNEVSHRAWNFTIAVLLSLITLPVVVILFAAVAWDSGRPVIYKGVRLGRHRQPFFMYKFRTLRPHAPSVTSQQALPARSFLETRIGKVMRETRLDELPQLWNVIKGDMNLFGPRPVRQEIAEVFESSIPHYNCRFTVRPGLIGHTQTFLPHRASKRLRAAYNYVLVNRPTSPVRELSFICMVTIIATAKIVTFAFRRLILMLRVGRVRDRRATHRARPRGAMVYMQTERAAPLALGPLKDINEEAFLFESRQRLKGIGSDREPRRLILDRRTPFFNKRCRAYCKAVITEVPRDRRGATAKELSGAHGESHLYLARYEATSELQRSLVGRHFTMSSFAAI